MAKHISFISILLLACTAAYANTATYKISVTIPAIVGVNTPPFNISENTADISANNSQNSIISEEIKRNGEKIVLNTVVFDD